MLTEENLKELRTALEKQHEQLTTDRNNESNEAAQMSAEAYEEHPLSNHMADEATDMHEQELEMGFREQDDNLLRQVEHALQLMDSGKYGYDEETGEPIPFERLQAIPYATRTVSHQTVQDSLNAPLPDNATLLQDNQVNRRLSS